MSILETKIRLEVSEVHKPNSSVTAIYIKPWTKSVNSYYDGWRMAAQSYNTGLFKPKSKKKKERTG